MVDVAKTLVIAVAMGASAGFLTYELLRYLYEDDNDFHN